MDIRYWSHKYYRFFICLICILLIIGSWLLPVTGALWDIIDLKTFHFLNSTVSSHQAQLFWGVMNSRCGDWLSEFILVFIFIHYVYSGDRSKRRMHWKQIIFTILLVVLTLVLINKILLVKIMPLGRLSPTLVVDSYIDLSLAFPFLNNKISSCNSLPGDHATMLILATASLWYYGSKPHKIAALITTIIFCLPRLISGAHWLSDLVVGAGTITLFSWGLAFGTPIYDYFITSRDTA